MSWEVLNTPFGLTIATGVGYVLKMLVDSVLDRYKKARAEKYQIETREQTLIQERAHWQEHAYAVRAIALEAGVKPDALPPMPAIAREDNE